ncbi:hypothetical protein Fcan01_17603 [Folsomia candida]|uniref:Uncharacterized protein n=1 Tax=Folsomia candida TaxID=158441 RepID=A0A226DQX6_FOLCA|nr:hypothetical protein Fcan01_17603 [Folsomia candida]
MAGREPCRKEQIKLFLFTRKDFATTKLVKKTKRHKSLITKIIAKWNPIGSVVSRKGKGRKRIKNSLVWTEESSKSDVKQGDICDQNVYRRTRGKPFISNRNQRRCLKWGRDHRAWTINDRKHVRWTDDIKFKSFRSLSGQFEGKFDPIPWKPENSGRLLFSTKLGALTSAKTVTMWFQDRKIKILSRVVQSPDQVPRNIYGQKSNTKLPTGLHLVRKA